MCIYMCMYIDVCVYVCVCVIYMRVCICIGDEHGRGYLGSCSERALPDTFTQLLPYPQPHSCYGQARPLELWREKM